VKTQLGLVLSVQPASQEPPRKFRFGSTERLADFIRACVDFQRTVCVAAPMTGGAYVSLAAGLIRILQTTLRNMAGEYVAQRIVRAYLSQFPPPENWTGVTVDELRSVSPDKPGFLANYKGQFVSEVVARCACAPEFLSMWNCLAIMNKSS